jgi:thiol-disulfide isomerase/thioredoxin
MITELSNLKSYQEFIQSNKVTLIHFWASWNGTDFAMKRLLNEIESLYENNAVFGFGSVDVDIGEMSDICKSVGLTNVPTLVYYKKGLFQEAVIGLYRKRGTEIEKKKEIDEKLKSLYLEIEK